MKDWTSEQLIDYKLAIDERIYNVRKDMKWYHSKKTKACYNTILKSFEDQLQLVNEEINKRLFILKDR